MLSFTLIYDDYLLIFNVTVLLRTLWPWLSPNNAIQLAAIPRFIHPRRVCRRCDRRSVELRRSRRCVPPLIRQAVPARGNAYAHKLAVALTGWRRAPEKRPGARTRRGRQESALRHGVGREWDAVFSGVGLPHKSLSLFYH